MSKGFVSAEFRIYYARKCSYNVRFSSIAYLRLCWGFIPKLSSWRDTSRKTLSCICFIKWFIHFRMYFIWFFHIDFRNSAVIRFREFALPLSKENKEISTFLKILVCHTCTHAHPHTHIRLCYHQFSLLE